MAVANTVEGRKQQGLAPQANASERQQLDSEIAGIEHGKILKNLIDKSGFSESLQNQIWNGVKVAGRGARIEVLKLLRHYRDLGRENPDMVINEKDVAENIFKVIKMGVDAGGGMSDSAISKAARALKEGADIFAQYEKSAHDGDVGRAKLALLMNDDKRKILGDIVYQSVATGIPAGDLVEAALLMHNTIIFEIDRIEDDRKEAKLEKGAGRWSGRAEERRRREADNLDADTKAKSVNVEVLETEFKLSRDEAEGVIAAVGKQLSKMAPNSRDTLIATTIAYTVVQQRYATAA